MCDLSRDSSNSFEDLGFHPKPMGYAALSDRAAGRCWLGAR